MIDISFEINGRKVNPNNVRDALESAILSSITDSVTKSINSIHCDKHHQKPVILVKGKSLDNLSMEVSGCCDDFISKVENRLS